MRRDEHRWGYLARMYQKTIAEFTVDRVLFPDAREFWLPKSANIKAVASLGQAHALSVRRLNVALVEGRHLLPDDLSPTGYHDFYIEGSREPIAMLYQGNLSTGDHDRGTRTIG
jgi:hypothetical protein